MVEREKINIPGENFYVEKMNEDNSRVLFAFFNNNPYEKLTPEDIKKIEEDIRDLGKWRIFKKLKKDLENKNG